MLKEDFPLRFPARMGFLGKLASLFRTSNVVDVSSRFELLREAISGTMSKFYMARDRKTDQIVGLKILDKEKTAALEQRFRGLEKPSEGEIAVSFKHPQIVTTFEHGLTTKGEQFLVMEFLDGPGMNSQIVARSAQLNGHRVKLIRQAAQALAEVHRMGYIHRDICPRNLVVSQDGESLKLIDFGLTVPAQPPFMQPGNRTGTPNYMAPEVVRRRPTSQLVDIFSFGVTAFEICTFELPWSRGASGIDAMRHGIVSPIDIRTLCKTINERLARAIHDCLNPEPTNRTSSMDRFLSAIQSIEREDEK